jgi:enoyl-CoA hydratase
VPTLARIDGPAVGAGVNLALACDVRIASTRARFVSGFAAVGIHPGGGHFHLIDRLTGRQAAAAMGLFADAVSASRAQDIGLTWTTVDPADLNEIVDRLIAPLRADPALARRAKSSFVLTTSSADAWTAATEVERSRQMWSLTRPRTPTR